MSQMKAEQPEPEPTLPNAVSPKAPPNGYIGRAARYAMESTTHYSWEITSLDDREWYGQFVAKAFEFVVKEGVPIALLGKYFDKPENRERIKTLFSKIVEDLIKEP